MKKLVLSAVLIAFYGYAMEYPGPIEKEGKQEKVKGKPAEKIPQVGILRINNKTGNNIVIILDGKPITGVIQPGKGTSVRIKVPMHITQPGEPSMHVTHLEEEWQKEFRGHVKLAIFNNDTKGHPLKSIFIIVTKYDTKYGFRLGYQPGNSTSFSWDPEEEIPFEVGQSWDFNLTLTIKDGPFGFEITYDLTPVER